MDQPNKPGIPQDGGRIIPIIAGMLAIGLSWWFPIFAGIIGLAGIGVSRTIKKQSPDTNIMVGVILCILGTLSGIVIDLLRSVIG